MSKETKVIMYDSEEAARYVTNIEGWVGSNGLFFGNSKDSEHCARYSGSTHRKCECGELMEKWRTCCRECKNKRDVERHAQREVVEWDGKTLLYSYYADEFFRDEDEIYDYCEEHSVDKSDLQLVLCDPVYLRPVDPDYWSDDLASESEVEFEDIASKEVIDLLKKLNAAIDKCGPASWTPGKKAVKL